MAGRKVDSRVSRRTKLKFANMFKELLKTKSFPSITVTELCEKCDLTRPTFYAHFKDKFDLVLWAYSDMINDTIRYIGEELTWSQAVVYKLEAMKREQWFYSEVYKSVDHDALLVRDAKIVHDYYVDNIVRLGGGGYLISMMIHSLRFTPRAPRA